MIYWKFPLWGRTQQGVVMAAIKWSIPKGQAQEVIKKSTTGEVVYYTVAVFDNPKSNPVTLSNDTTSDWATVAPGNTTVVRVAALTLTAEEGKAFGTFEILYAH